MARAKRASGLIAAATDQLAFDWDCRNEVGHDEAVVTIYADSVAQLLTRVKRKYGTLDRTALVEEDLAVAAELIDAAVVRAAIGCLASGWASAMPSRVSTAPSSLAGADSAAASTRLQALKTESPADVGPARSDGTAPDSNSPAARTDSVTTGQEVIHKLVELAVMCERRGAAYLLELGAHYEAARQFRRELDGNSDGSTDDELEIALGRPGGARFAAVVKLPIDGLAEFAYRLIADEQLAELGDRPGTDSCSQRGRHVPIIIRPGYLVKLIEVYLRNLLDMSRPEQAALKGGQLAIAIGDIAAECELPSAPAIVIGQAPVSQLLVQHMVTSDDPRNRALFVAALRSFLAV